MTDPSPAHAPLPPSSAGRWRQCGRSPSLEAAYPEDEDGEEAREGTAAHWYMQQALTGHDVLVGEIAENGVPVTTEMIENIQPLLDDVARMVREVAARNNVTEEHVRTNWLRVEQRLHMRSVHPTDNWGTCDIYLVDHADRHIYIWDFKYGHGYVDHGNNWQMIDYAQGVVEDLGWAPGAYTVSMSVYQPRCYHRGPALRTWTISGDEHAKLVRELHLAAKLVSPNAQARTGDACTHCKGIVPCEANQRMAGFVADMAMQSTSDMPTPASMGAEYAMLLTAQARLKARIVGLEEAIKANPTGTGWIREQGFGREKWAVPASEVFDLGDLMGLDLRKPQEPITPVQARKLGLDAEVSKGYSTTPRGEVKLVRQSSSAAARAFAEE